nr:hypothetical protein [Tanacetum cinerariifolium]
MEDLKQQYLDELKCLSNLEYHDEIKIAELKENFNGMSIDIRKKEKLLQQEQWAYLSNHPSKRLNSFCYDDDDDEDYTSVITPDESILSTEETDNSLSMGDEHLDTILATESDEVIKSSVETLIPIPSESEGILEHVCDVPSHDVSLESQTRIKDRPPMLAPGNYVQWKSRIKRYIDTKPNHELIHYCLKNPPYELGWKDKEVPTSEGSLVTRTERVNETYKNVSQDIRDQLNAKAEALQIILTGIDNDIYSTVDAFLASITTRMAKHEVNEIRAEKIARVANP